MLQPIELLLNRGIRSSTTAAQLCEQLDGRELAIRLEDTGIGLRIGVIDGRLRVTERAGEDADAVMTGGPLSLQRLLGSNPEAAIRDGSVKISGDAEIAAGFRSPISSAGWPGISEAGPSVLVTRWLAAARNISRRKAATCPHRRKSRNSVNRLTNLPMP
jgi:hypothetical protein